MQAAGAPKARPPRGETHGEPAAGTPMKSRLRRCELLHQGLLHGTHTMQDRRPRQTPAHPTAGQHSHTPPVHQPYKRHVIWVSGRWATAPENTATHTPAEPLPPERHSAQTHPHHTTIKPPTGTAVTVPKNTMPASWPQPACPAGVHSRRPALQNAYRALLRGLLLLLCSTEDVRTCSVAGPLALRDATRPCVWHRCCCSPGMLSGSPMKGHAAGKYC